MTSNPKYSVGDLVVLSCERYYRKDGDNPLTVLPGDKARIKHVFMHYEDGGLYSVAVRDSPTDIILVSEAEIKELYVDPPVSSSEAELEAQVKDLKARLKRADRDRAELRQERDRLVETLAATNQNEEAAKEEEAAPISALPADHDHCVHCDKVVPWDGENIARCSECEADYNPQGVEHKPPSRG